MTGRVLDPFAERVPLLDLASMHAEVRVELDRAWAAALDGSRFIGGEAVDTLEAAWAARCGTKHAVGVASGTDALVLSLRALGIGAGDEVIVPTNTFIATAEAVALVGATPRFVDVDDRTLLMSPGRAMSEIGARTAAVIVVHLYGNGAWLDELRAVADRHGIALLEDASQAHGAMWRGRPLGSYGRLGTFSFYPGKNLGALGDGGAVVTDDDDLARSIRSLANHGRCETDGARHRRGGMNSRLDAIQAAVLTAKLPRLGAWNEARRAVGRQYRERLGGIVRMVEDGDGAVPVHHQFVVRIPDRDRVRRDLAEVGIETGIHYPTPCHRQPGWEHYPTSEMVVAESASEEILSLPISPHLGASQVPLVCEALAQAIRPLEVVGG